MDFIKITGARTHNLKNIDIDIPRDKLVVITGVSGSGKSSLAFDTIYAEGQRRYVESLSAYARQFLSMSDKPDVDNIEGLSPAISIEQKSTSHNPRSTVGTITEIYDYLRLLFARSGIPHCPKHKKPLLAQTISQMVDQVLNIKYTKNLMLLSPIIQDKKGEHLNVFSNLLSQGFTKARIDGFIYDLDATPKLNPKIKHNIDIIVDRFSIKNTKEFAQRLTESFETALNLSEGIAKIEALPDNSSEKPKSKSKEEFEPIVFSSNFACPICNYSITELEPRLFSFNAPMGACPTCDGLGIASFFDLNKIIKNPKLSLADGAIALWGKSNPRNHVMLLALGNHYNFKMTDIWESLPKNIQEIILYGSKDKIRFKYLRGFTRTHGFEGVINKLQRKYQEASLEDKAQFNQFMSFEPCHDCMGSRLNLAARNVLINGISLPEIVIKPVNDCLDYFKKLKIEGHRGIVASKIVKEIIDRLSFLSNVGLDYLTLDRKADTLSGGEAQRIRLASQIGAGLVGVMYVLDEPSIGLHQKDNDRLLSTLTHLRDIGNTVIVVEHDLDAIMTADYILDIGPLAGVHGGEVVAKGSAKDIMKNPKSLTGQYLSGKKKIEVPKTRTKPNWQQKISITKASGNNLKNVDVDIPVGLLTCVTGVSGSGKSTLINDTLFKLATNILNKSDTTPAPYKKATGFENFDKVIDIDQSPIGKTPRSNPATYTGLFTPLRELFAQLPLSRQRGYTPGRFSFNVKGGRCEACSGDGLLKVEMHFLPDIYVLCDVCKGKRYNNQTLEVTYKGLNISQILDLTVEDALDLFKPIPAIYKKLQTLHDVGLSYIKLGQSATTLSGGEAQRIKLSKELSKRDTGKTLYILDEPTTGLHFYDIEHLLGILNNLKKRGNTIVVIEHNLDVIKTADWIIDLGPGGGINGGQIIATGSPENIAKNKKSVTGKYLKPLLD